jgi:hypothetical protein
VLSAGLWDDWVVTSSELGAGQVGAASRWVTPATVPRVLILVVAVLVLANIPLTHFGSGPPDYVWTTVGTLAGLWRLWDHRRWAWIALIAVLAVTLLIYALAIAGVINMVQPGWWIAITGTGDIAALAILLSRPMRGWVAKRPAPASQRR